MKNRTTEFDRKRDYEALLARAWSHGVEQQTQRDGVGIANATVVEGVACFLRAVDLRPGIEDILSLVISIGAPRLQSESLRVCHLFDYPIAMKIPCQVLGVVCFVHANDTVAQIARRLFLD